MYEYNAVVLNVHDGDTLRAEIDLGFHLTMTTDVRLLGINAPELGKVKTPILAGQASTEALLGFLGGASLFTPIRTSAPFGMLGNYIVLSSDTAPRVVLRTTLGDQFEKYGRVLADVLMSEYATTTVNQQMLSGGWAVVDNGS